MEKKLILSILCWGFKAFQKLYAFMMKSNYMRKHYKGMDMIANDDTITNDTFDDAEENH